jgi:hypothetical protein
MIALVLDALILCLFVLHCAWMGMFALEVLFDTSLTTAAERWRSLSKYVAFGILITAAIATLLFVRLFQPGWYA